MRESNRGSCNTNPANDRGGGGGARETKAGTDEIEDILIAIGEPAVPALCQELDRPDTALRARISDMPFLLEGVKDPDPDVRTSTVYAVTQLMFRLPNQVGDWVEDDAANASGANAAAIKLAASLKAKVVRALLCLLDDPDSQVRWAAVYAFQNMECDDPRVFRRLIEMAKDKATRIRRGATICLENLMVPSDGYVRKAVDERLRLVAIECLATYQTRSAAVVPVLIDALVDGDPLTRLHVVNALGNLGQSAKEAVPALRQALCARQVAINQGNSVDFDARDLTIPTTLAAIGSLARIGQASEPAIPELIDLLFDRVAEVRDQAVEALGQIGPAAAVCVPALVHQIERGLLESSIGADHE